MTNNTMIYTDRDCNNSSVERVEKINVTTETQASDLKRTIYESEN